MGTWSEGEDEMTCGCGAVNIVPYKDYPEKDKGSIDCAKCGKHLHSWKGTRDYRTPYIKEE